MRAALLSFLFLFLPGAALMAQSARTLPSETPATDSTKKATGDSAVIASAPKMPSIHQLRFGFDLYRIAYNIMYPSRTGYEAQVDYALTRKTYLVAETGFGGGKIDYDFLKYDTKAYFLRLGLDQQFLDVISDRDFDIGFIGVRLATAVGNRSAVTYTVPSPFGPPSEGTADAQNYAVFWGEITGGIKVEVWKGLFVGWSIRGKFMFNSGVFKDLSPNYIPGYGKGDKTTNFDFNFYLSYALRWKGKR